MANTPSFGLKSFLHRGHSTPTPTVDHSPEHVIIQKAMKDLEDRAYLRLYLEEYLYQDEMVHIFHIPEIRVQGKAVPEVLELGCACQKSLIYAPGPLIHVYKDQIFIVDQIHAFRCSDETCTEPVMLHPGVSDALSEQIKHTTPIKVPLSSLLKKT